MTSQCIPGFPWSLTTEEITNQPTGHANYCGHRPMTGADVFVVHLAFRSELARYEAFPSDGSNLRLTEIGFYSGLKERTTRPAKSRMTDRGAISNTGRHAPIKL